MQAVVRDFGFFVVDFALLSVRGQGSKADEDQRKNLGNHVHGGFPSRGQWMGLGTGRLDLTHVIGPAVAGFTEKQSVGLSRVEPLRGRVPRQSFTESVTDVGEVTN